MIAVRSTLLRLRARRRERVPWTDLGSRFAHLRARRRLHVPLIAAVAVGVALIAGEVLGARTPLPAAPAPAPAVAQGSAAGVVATLRADRVAGRRALAAAARPAAQAAAARALAQAYDRAEARLADFNGTAAVQVALGDVAAAYRSLAVAADGGRRGAYDAARARVAARERALARLLRAG